MAASEDIIEQEIIAPFKEILYSRSDNRQQAFIALVKKCQYVGNQAALITLLGHFLDRFTNRYNQEDFSTFIQSLSAVVIEPRNEAEWAVYFKCITTLLQDTNRYCDAIWLLTQLFPGEVARSKLLGYVIEHFKDIVTACHDDDSSLTQPYTQETAQRKTRILSNNIATLVKAFASPQEQSTLFDLVVMHFQDIILMKNQTVKNTSDAIATLAEGFYYDESKKLELITMAQARGSNVTLESVNARILHAQAGCKQYQEKLNNPRYTMPADSPLCTTPGIDGKKPPQETPQLHKPSPP